MTYPQFLKALRKHRGTFQFVNHGRIRQKGTGCCPIEAIAGGQLGVLTAGRSLGIRTGITIKVMVAADYDFRSKTRRDLLRVLGLKEK